VALEIWTEVRQNRPQKSSKYGFFVINLPLINQFFYKVWHGGGRPRSALLRQISPLWLLKCGIAAPKIAKNGNF